jgi:phosphatidylglycerophosphatase A
LKEELARVLATWFGCGYSPIGPGTAGSLGALLVAWPLRHQPQWFFILLALIFLAPAIWSASSTALQVGKKDPQIVVIDEVVGQWIALAGVLTYSPIAWLIAFGLFRGFDIWKPWPVRRLERLPSGTGIVMDDVMAGIYAALVLYLIGWNNSISKFIYGIS